MLRKILGWGFAILGVAIIVFGPWTGIHQQPPGRIGATMVFIGLVILGIGLLLIKI